MNLIKDFEETFICKSLPTFRIGDTVKVHLRIVEEAEENGSKKKNAVKKEAKERVQVFSGTVISKAGSGLSETFTLYRNAYGSSMERVFLLHSPKIAKIEVARSGRVRRAKLTYIRGRAGKAAKIREKIGAFNKAASKNQKEHAADKMVEATENENIKKPAEKFQTQAESANSIEKQTQPEKDKKSGQDSK